MPLRVRRKLAFGLSAIAAATAGVVVLLSTHASSAAAPPGPPQAVQVTCRSPSLSGTLPVMVYLPAGYRQSSLRYPVIYFLHGLPADPDSYTANPFVAQAVSSSGREAIVVSPRGAQDKDGDREYLDWAPDENWPGAIANDLPKCIDSRFRTVAERRGRALIGASAGGYGAFNIGLRHLDKFAAVESWSGYFAATDPSGRVMLNLGSGDANRRAQVPGGRDLVQALADRPTFIGFYVGSQDDTFFNANVSLEKALSADHVNHLFRIYSGSHTVSLWEQWAPVWLGYALDHLAPPKS
jgi:S-formylglutathione hydrolase FrmB